MENTTVIHNPLPWGVYVWRKADGTLLSNDEGEVFSLNGYKGDLNAIKKMRDGATALGHGDGVPAFLPGSRKISRSEWEDQMAEMIDGNPIPNDPGELL